MHTQLVMTVIGDDRRGIVDSLASIVKHSGGNWLDSRMALLGGKFAGILRVSCPDEAVDSLRTALKALDKEGLEVHVEENRDTDTAIDAGESIFMEVVGQDRPGIVSQISSAIASQGGNVEKLDTGCESAPMSGELLFTARIKLRLPEGTSLDSLQDAIEKIAADLMVDITFPE